MLQINRFILGELGTNCYLVYDTEKLDAIVIDPSVHSDELKSIILENRLNLRYIINTHGHADHIGGNNFLKNFNKNSRLAIHENDAEFLTDVTQNLSIFLGENIISFPADILLKDGEILEFGNGHKIKILATPGHTLGSICLILDDEIMFSGDTLFHLSVGRTDLAHSSIAEMLKSIAKLKNLALEKDKNYTVYPGHGEATKLNYEVKNNEYFR